MPILVTPTAATTTSVATGAATPPTYPVDRWSWTSAAGRVRDLMAEHPYLRPGGIQGHMSPPVSIIDSLPPSMDGGVYRGHQYEPRDVFLTMMGHTRVAGTWRGLTRQVVSDFDTTTAAGVLSILPIDGAPRSLQCRYVNGLDSPVAGEPGVVRIGTWVVQLRAYDPWWYGPAMSRKFQVSTEADWFPGPTFTINPTELLGSPATVNNPGDVEAYPVWTITGPCTDVTAAAESGASWTVNADLSAGETITVDCDPRLPGNTKIVDGDGTNLWGVVTEDYPDLWALPAGESTVTVSMGGSSTASRVTLAFNPRYRTA